MDTKKQERITINCKIQRLFGSNLSICSYEIIYERVYADDGYHANVQVEM
jgi:hypothetical protein